MSRAAILIALSRVLHRQPTPEDMATFCGELLQLCPAGRVYVSEKPVTEVERKEAIANLLAGGMSIRAVSRELGCDRREVREVARVGGTPAFCAPTP